MIIPYARGSRAIGLARATLTEPAPAPLEQGIVEWLARLRLLEGVPFAYLVPDEQMLPRESIRFFYVNRNWTDVAAEGALSLSATASADRAQLQGRYADLRQAVDEAERNVRPPQVGEPTTSGAAEVLTGFLLRSRAVSGWPGLEVRAFRAGDNGPEPLRLLRVERLAPAVLLVLFDGVPDKVEIEEPRQGLQFGVDPHDQAADQRVVRVRNPQTGVETGATVGVPFRAGAPGVIDVATLRDRLAAQGAAGADGTVSPAEFGLQMVQFAYRQEFRAQEGVPIAETDVFAPTVPMDEIRPEETP